MWILEDKGKNQKSSKAAEDFKLNNNEKLTRF